MGPSLSRSPRPRSHTRPAPAAGAAGGAAGAAPLTQIQIPIQDPGSRLQPVSASASDAPLPAAAQAGVGSIERLCGDAASLVERFDLVALLSAARATTGGVLGKAQARAGPPKIPIPWL